MPTPPTARRLSTPEAAAAYFGLVFGAGFVLGTLRALWLAPAVGERAAELVETPFMLVAVFLAARFVVGRMNVADRTGRLSVGGLALGLLVLAEWGVVRFVRGESLSEYVAARDPVSGSVYLLALLLFALAPALVGGRGRVSGV